MRRIADARRRAEERARGGPGADAPGGKSAPKRGSPGPVGSPEDPNAEPFDQGIAEQVLPLPMLAPLTTGYGLVAPDVLGPPPGPAPSEVAPPPSVKVPAKPMHRPRVRAAW